MWRGPDTRRDGYGVRFLLRGMKYFSFSFLALATETKRIVECRHSTRNASRIGQKLVNVSVLMGTKYLNTRFPDSLYLPCYFRNVV